MALAALIVSIIALAVAIATAGYNRRNAVAAEDSAVSSARSADAAKESVESARSSAESAAVVARAEIEREHRDLRPVEPDMPKAVVMDRYSETGRGNRFLEFVLPRTYRLQGEVIIADARHPRDLGVAAEGGVKIRMFLDGKDGVQAEAVRIRFWPPVDVDPGERWACQCDRPLADQGGPHWEWYFAIPKRRGPAVIY
jgi:hypothetical protein